MIRVAVWVALWSRVVAEAATYGEYAGAVMPQYDYDAPHSSLSVQPQSVVDLRPMPEEYHEELPETTHFDYGVGGKPQGKKRSVDRELDVDYLEHPKQVKNYKKIRKSTKIYDNEKQYLEEDKYPRHVKHEPRIKVKDSPENDEGNRSYEYRRKYSQMEDDRNAMSAEEESAFSAIDVDEEAPDTPIMRRKHRTKATPERIIRRKPRDKMMRVFQDNSGEEPGEEHRKNPFGNGYHPEMGRGGGGDGEPPLKEYEEYYDMKRANAVRQNLPLLMDKPRVPGSTKVKKQWAPAPLPAMPTVPTIGAVVQQSVTTASRTTLSSTIPAPNGTEELSLAEKSRLSIMKKAFRKESLKNGTTTKPPVLLQVTNRMHTLVMVEPVMTGAGVMPQMRAVSEESPERLQRVRRLMRRKLVNNARDISDLTANWDDLVCDYIDTALLNRCSRCAGTPSIVYLAVMLILKYTACLV